MNSTRKSQIRSTAKISGRFLPNAVKMSEGEPEAVFLYLHYGGDPLRRHFDFEEFALLEADNSGHQG